MSSNLYYNKARAQFRVESDATRLISSGDEIWKCACADFAGMIARIELEAKFEIQPGASARRNNAA